MLGHFIELLSTVLFFGMAVDPTPHCWVFLKGSRAGRRPFVLVLGPGSRNLGNMGYEGSVDMFISASVQEIIETFLL